MRLVIACLVIVSLAGCTTKRQAGIGIATGLGIAVASVALGGYVDHDNHQEPGGGFAIAVIGGLGGIGVATVSVLDLGVLVLLDHAPPSPTGSGGSEIGAEGSSCTEALEHCAYGLACQQGVCKRVP